MEFFVMRTGEVKNVELKNKKWFLHEFGITDKRGSEFLEALEENVNSLFQQELFILDDISLSEVLSFDDLLIE